MCTPEPEHDIPEFTILMPCLNEVETIELCILKANEGLRKAGVTGEILVADNGSNDGSQEVAIKAGARVVIVEEKGYGSALRGGIETALGNWVIMGDADDSYDFSEISGFVEKLKQGYDLVMGCRLPRGGGTVLPGAMPWKHRWIGNPVLSFIGRLFFNIPVDDFHCGLRGFNRKAILTLDLHTTGMEFASEMVIKANLHKLSITQIPIKLYPDGRSRPPHLRSWRDGWRHLRFMLLYSPRWLFLIPGIISTMIGITVILLLLPEPLQIGNIIFDIHSMLYAALAIIFGYQTIFFWFLTKIFAIREGFLPEDPQLNRIFRFIKLETGLFAGFCLVIIGFFGSFAAVLHWRQAGFGDIDPSQTQRIVIPSVISAILGFQTVFNSFFFSLLGLKRR